MTDLEVVLSLLVVWAAWVALTVADELVHAKMCLVGRENTGGVEGHADEPKREAHGEPDEGPNQTIRSSHCVRGFAAERERRQRMEPALAGIKPGPVFSGPASPNSSSVRPLRFDSGSPISNPGSHPGERPRSTSAGGPSVTVADELVHARKVRRIA